MLADGVSREEVVLGEHVILGSPLPVLFPVHYQMKKLLAHTPAIPMFYITIYPESTKPRAEQTHEIMSQASLSFLTLVLPVFSYTNEKDLKKKKKYTFS